MECFRQSLQRGCVGVEIPRCSQPARSGLPDGRLSRSLNDLNPTPFSLRIFVADGDPDGLRIVERFNASARAVVFPRALLPQVKARPELQRSGVYFL